MIISTIANALVQCIARTQAGWMTFPVAGVTCWSLTVRLDMADPSWLIGPWCLLPAYTPAIGFPLLHCTHQVHRWWASRSQKSEPGVGRLASWRVPLGTSPCGTKRARAGLRRRHQHGVDHMDDAVRLMDVGDRDHRGIALGVDDPDL